MENLIPEIRNTVRAVIIREQKVLLLKKQDDTDQIRYALPGGAQEPGETLISALIRECQEEIGCIVDLQDILYVADFFKRKTSTQPAIRHQLEILFMCNVPETYRPRNGAKPDKHQVDVLWVNIHELPDKTIFPTSMTELLTKKGQEQQPVYLGKID